MDRGVLDVGSEGRPDGGGHLGSVRRLDAVVGRAQSHPRVLRLRHSVWCWYGSDVDMIALNRVPDIPHPSSQLKKKSESKGGLGNVIPIFDTKVNPVHQVFRIYCINMHQLKELLARAYEGSSLP